MKDFDERLTSERRARLCAERRLTLAESRAEDTRAQLVKTSRRLTEDIISKRAELDALRDEAETLRRKQAELENRLEKSTQRAKSLERTLWEAIQSLRDGFAIFDAENRLVVANRAYLSIFDGMREVVPGVTYERICRLLCEEGIVDPEDHGGAWVDHMLDRWGKDEIPSMNMRLWSGQVIKLIDRRLADGGVVSLGIDLTDALRVSSAIEAIPDGFVIFDEDDKVVMCNETYRDLYGITPEQVDQGITFTDLVRLGIERGQYSDAIGREDAWMEERIEAHEARNGLSFEERLTDGRWIKILERSTLDGGMAGLRIDVTELKEQQAELDRMHRAVYSAEKARSSFLSNMSHEMRTALNGVVGTTDLLMESALDPDQRALATALSDSASGLLSLIEDVLDLSSSEAGQLDLTLSPFSPRAAIDAAMSGFAAKALKKDLTLRFDGAEDLQDWLIGDAKRLRQVVSTLVGNAVKVTQSGQVIVTAGTTPSDKREGHMVLHVDVADSGPGIPDDRIDTIFDEFAYGQEDGGNQQTSGLGPAICKRLIDQMGGEIRCKQGPDGGAVFAIRLTLPIAQAPNVADQLESVSEKKDENTEPPTVSVVAADDNETNRLVLRKLLSTEDVTLSMHENGPAALDAIENNRPDLVLLDISMPQMNGTEVARLVREAEEREGLSAARLVAITAHAMPGDLDGLLSDGFDRALTKPLRKKDLHREIEAALASRQAADDAASDRKNEGASGSENSGE